MLCVFLQYEKSLWYDDFLERFVEKKNSQYESMDFKICDGRPKKR